MELRKLFVCPFCHGQLIKNKSRIRCGSCLKIYSIKSGIPDFTDSKSTSEIHKKSQSEYETIHKKPWSHLHDGSYEILAAFARGNKTLDVACGDGFIEEIYPQTVGLDFSLNALLKAKKKGAQYLVQAAAEQLPFKDNSFDLCICSGSLEHFADPLKAVAEMVRVSKIQLIIVHSSIPGHHILSKLLQVRHQPLERPLQSKTVERMLEKDGAHVVYKGVWTLPVNYGRVIRWLPQLSFIPSSSFIISRKIS